MKPKFPFDPARIPFFYGWAIVGVAMLGILASIPGQTTGVSAFTDSLIEATGLSRFQLANTYLVGTVLSGLMLPKGGELLDRWGARRMVIFASVGLGLVLMYMSSADQVGNFLASWTGSEDSFLPHMLAMGLGFTALRFFGQGMMMVVSRTMIGKWFDRRRGLVTSITTPFISFSFNGAPYVLSLLIGVFSWRGAWQVLSWVVGPGMAVIGWLFYRDNPEECGLLMDGGPGTLKAAKRQQTASRDFSRAEAIRTLAFWTPTSALAAQGLFVTGLTFHLIDLGASQGISHDAAMTLLVPVSIVSTVTGIAVGPWADRVSPRVLVMTMMLVQAGAIASVGSIGEPIFYGLAVFFLGASGGFFGAISTVSIPYYFGRKHFGAIGGMQMMILVLATSVGPSLFAASRDWFGTYQPALNLCLLLPVSVFVMAFVTRRPD